MGDCLLLKASGGLDADELTATAGDVLKGMIAGVKGIDDPVTGTLQLTGNVAPGDVLTGKTFYGTNAKLKQTGTMPNQGGKTSTLNCGGSYTIPAGYHNGSGRVTANALTGQTSANAAAANILSGKTAWVNGSKITGAMKNWEGIPNHIINRRNANGRFEVAVDAGFHGCYWNGKSYEYMEYSEVASTLGLSAGNLAQGITKCGIAGTYKGLGNATASQVLSGSKFSTASLSNATGTMPNRGTVSSSLNCGGSYTIPAGYHSGSGRVTANSLSGQTAATATAGQIWTGKTAWVNGSKITGTLATQGGSTTTPGTTNKTIVTANKIVTGNIVVAGDPDLRPENIKAGKNVFGVTGNVLAADDLIALMGGVKIGFSYADDTGGSYTISKNRIMTKASEGKGIVLAAHCVQPDGWSLPSHRDLIFKTTVSSYWTTINHTSTWQMTLSVYANINYERVHNGSWTENKSYTKTVETSSSPFMDCGVTDIVYTEGSGGAAVYMSVTKMEIFYKGILLKTYTSGDFK